MVYLAFGGNLGDTAQLVQNALRLLEEGGFHQEALSTAYVNPAVGCEDGAPDFTNFVCRGRWDASPEALLQLTQSIEIALGRPADHPHWHSRTLDIDILFCNGELRQSPRLTLPHPRWQERDFVRIPLAEVLLPGVPPQEADEK